MTSIFQSILSLLLGLALALFGTAHAFARYPDPATFARLLETLPTLGAVLFFALGIAAAAAGLILSFVSVRRIRRASRHVRSVTGLRPVPIGHGYRDPDEREWAEAYR